MPLTIINKKNQKEISQRKLEMYEKYVKVITWGRAYPIEFCSRFMGIELLDMQKYAIYNSWFSDFVIWLQCRNAGKALSLDTKIPTPNGIKTMGDIQPNDYVYDADGKPTRVLSISPVFTNHKCYKIKFDDGEEIIADENHLWAVRSRTMSVMKQRHPDGNCNSQALKSMDQYGFTVMATKDLIHNYKKLRNDKRGYEYNYRIPTAKPIYYEEKELPISPYTLGYWLGDGTKCDPSITCHIDDADEVCENIRNDGFSIVKYMKDKRNPNVWKLCFKDKKDNRIVFNELIKNNNLYGNKHIPEIYFTSSIEQRLELLQGLMDSDGFCDKSGKCCEFSQKSDILTKDFCRLLDTLSIQYSLKKRYTNCNGKKCLSNRIVFHTTKEFPCFKLKRKYNRLSDKETNQRHTTKTIISIEETATVPTKCIIVDNERSLFLCGEHNTVTHNSTEGAIYTMLRSLLIPNHVTYFLGNTGQQAKSTYKKIEKISRREISSFVGCTDLFINELVKNGATSDGFVHDPASFTLKLFNGSEVNTLNSDITNIKGNRASLVFFDEAGWFSDELFVQAENFANQDENFKLGGNVNIALEPKEFPLQLIYASSASDTSSGFYKRFKQFSKNMLMGDKKYFACNFNIDMVMSAKFNGEPYPPLLSKDKVDKALESDHDKAMRELYNKFSADSHEGQILTRRDIMKYTQNRPPLMFNDTGNRLFAFSWDSARLNDNSVILIAELINDPEIGWRMELQNMVSLVDIATKKRIPKRLPEQVDDFKELLLRYNGNEKGRLDYENIKAIICDSGAGGQMVGGVADYLVENWKGKDGRMHKGIIDRNHKSSETAKNKYPDAVDIMKLVDPKGNRNAIFDSLEKMVKLGVVTFPAEYNDKDYLYFINDDGTEEKYNLSMEEKLSLAQFELLKTEVVTMCKYESQGNITYNYPPDKRNVLHDDRCFALGLMCFYLAQLRHGTVFEKKKPEIKLNVSALCRRPTIA